MLTCRRRHRKALVYCFPAHTSRSKAPLIRRAKDSVKNPVQTVLLLVEVLKHSPPKYSCQKIRAWTQQVLQSFAAHLCLHKLGVSGKSTAEIDERLEYLRGRVLAPGPGLKRSATWQDAGPSQNSVTHTIRTTLTSYQRKPRREQ